MPLQLSVAHSAISKNNNVIEKRIKTKYCLETRCFDVHVKFCSNSKIKSAARTVIVEPLFLKTFFCYVHC